MTLQLEAEKAQDIQRVRALAEEYERAMTSLIKALYVVRKESLYINKLTSEDQKIASNYKIQGFFIQKTNLIINGYSLAAYAREALIHLAERLPTLFRDSGIVID